MPFFPMAYVGSRTLTAIQGMGILIPGSVHSTHRCAGSLTLWLQLKSCCESEVWRQQREKETATLYNSSL